MERCDKSSGNSRPQCRKSGNSRTCKWLYYFLLADHGNADYEINEDGTPNTAHSLNLVPFFVIDKEWQGILKSGKLGDIAPTILSLMDLPIPKEMTGNIFNCLINNERLLKQSIHEKNMEVYFTVVTGFGDIDTVLSPGKKQECKFRPVSQRYQ